MVLENPSPHTPSLRANAKQSIQPQTEEIATPLARNDEATPRLMPKETRGLTPALRFPEFSGEWEEKSLKQVCEMQAGKFIPASSIKENQTINLYPCYGGNGLRGYTEEYTHTGEYPLIGRQGALCGNVNFVQGKFYATEHAIVTSPKNKIDSKWLFYQLGRLNLNRLATGQAQPGLSVDTLKSVHSFIPVIQEQQKIADFLTAVDARIAHLQQKHSLLQTYKKGLMQQLFSQALRFTQPNGSPYPAWEEKRLGEVFNERSERGNPEAELLSVTLNQGIVKASLMDRTISASTDRGNYKTVYTNDIVYNSMRMWQGASGVSSCYGIVSPAYTVIIPNQNQDSLFWAYYFKLSKNIHIFKRCSQGLTSDTWNLKFPAFSKIKMFFPCKEEQQKIAACLTAVDAKISLTAQAIQHAQAFKKGLLQQMFV